MAAGKKQKQEQEQKKDNRVTVRLSARNLRYLDLLSSLGTFGSTRPTVARSLIEASIHRLQTDGFVQKSQAEQRAKRLPPLDDDAG